MAMLALYCTRKKILLRGLPGATFILPCLENRGSMRPSIFKSCFLRSSIAVVHLERFALRLGERPADLLAQLLQCRCRQFQHVELIGHYGSTRQDQLIGVAVRTP